MGRKTIVIIISLVSAFMLMSGGYGLWREPLIITGNIEVRERPQSVVVAPLIPIVLDPNQAGIVNPNITVNPEGSNGLEDSTNMESTDPATIDNSEAVVDENVEEISPPSIGAEVEEQKEEETNGTENVQQENDVMVNSEKDESASDSDASENPPAN